MTIAKRGVIQGYWEENMDLYLDFDNSSKRRRRNSRRRRRRNSKKPFIIVAVMVLIVIVAAGAFFGVQYIQKKEQEAKIRKQQKQTVTVMFPEGYSVDMMAKRLEDKGIFKASDFIAAVKNTDQYKNSWIKEIPNTNGMKYRLEGFLYPDTYNIYKNSKPSDLVQKMLDNYEKKYNQLSQGYKGKHSRFELTVMASIIEREAKVEKERPVIAGVIENRLKKKMKLQMCPTVLYVTTNGLYNAEKVYYRNLKVKSPYNTYQNKGLPVGAICNPGSSALKAAMNPQKTDYLYYVAKGDSEGTHIFSKTYKQHEDARIIKDKKKKKTSKASNSKKQNKTKDSKASSTKKNATTTAKKAGTKKSKSTASTVKTSQKTKKTEKKKNSKSTKTKKEGKNKKTKN